MGYVTLGTRGPVTGQLDTTGLNPGNWTVVFDQSNWDVTVPYFQCYRITLTGAPESTFEMYVDQKRWEVTQNGDWNSWEPAGDAPMLLQPSQNVYFLWSNLATDGKPPQVTMWLRYDDSITANAVTQGTK